MPNAYSLSPKICTLNRSMAPSVGCRMQYCSHTIKLRPKAHIHTYNNIFFGCFRFDTRAFLVGVRGAGVNTQHTITTTCEWRNCRCCRETWSGSYNRQSTYPSYFNGAAHSLDSNTQHDGCISFRSTAKQNSRKHIICSRCRFPFGGNATNVQPPNNRMNVKFLVIAIRYFQGASSTWKK